jgi:hypothetical protein
MSMKKTARKTKKQGGAAPPTDEHDDAVERGRQAWKSLKETGRTHAMEVAQTKKPNGAKYAEAFNVWLMERNFDDIDKSDRAKLLSIMEDLERIERWRERLTEAQRVAWNHPSTIWRIARCKNRGIEAVNEKSEAPIPNPKDLPPASIEVAEEEEEEEEEDEEVSWQRGLALRIRKAIGDIKILDWRLPEPPDKGLIAVVQELIDEAKELHEYLQRVVHEESIEVGEETGDASQPQHERVLEGAD